VTEATAKQLTSANVKINIDMHSNSDSLHVHQGNIMKKENTESASSPRSIGGIGNYYGGLSVKTEGGKHFWSIENYDGDSWDKIPTGLFDALNAFQDSRENRKQSHS
jgi:hypothetical protein